MRPIFRPLAVLVGFYTACFPAFAFGPYEVGDRVVLDSSGGAVVAIMGRGEGRRILVEFDAGPLAPVSLQYLPSEAAIQLRPELKPGFFVLAQTAQGLLRGAISRIDANDEVWIAPGEELGDETTFLRVGREQVLRASAGPLAFRLQGLAARIVPPAAQRPDQPSPSGTSEPLPSTGPFGRLELGDRILFSQSQGTVVGFGFHEGNAQTFVKYDAGQPLVGLMAYRHPDRDLLRPLVHEGSWILARESGSERTFEGLVVEVRSREALVLSSPRTGGTTRVVSLDHIIRASDRPLRRGTQAAFLAAREGLIPTVPRDITRWEIAEQDALEAQPPGFWAQQATRLRLVSAAPAPVDIAMPTGLAPRSLAPSRRLFETRMSGVFVSVEPDGAVNLVRLAASGAATIAAILPAGSLTAEHAAAPGVVSIGSDGSTIVVSGSKPNGPLTTTVDQLLAQRRGGAPACGAAVGER